MKTRLRVRCRKANCSIQKYHLPCNLMAEETHFTSVYMINGRNSLYMGGAPGLKCNFLIIVFMSCIWLVGCWKFTSLRVCKLHLLNLKYFDICRLWSLRNLPCFYIMWRILAFLHLTCIHPNIQSDKFLPHRISPSIYKIKHIRVKVCSICPKSYHWYLIFCYFSRMCIQTWGSIKIINFNQDILSC